jgi:pyrroloquinoline quinone biosynthesis protein B
MQVKILGSGQDAGIPQIDCYCPACRLARKYKKYRRLGPSLAISNGKDCVLIDASPDIKPQLEMTGKGKGSLKGIILTHAHFGHCVGLLSLGKESLNTKNIPVFCTPKIKRFLYKNYPFSLLVKNKNIIINEINPDKQFKISGIKYTPFKVPHRDEIADTVGYTIEAKKRIIYLPDIDYWTLDIIKKVNNSDIAFIDGTFYSSRELPRFKQVPHPPIEKTMSLLKNSPAEIYFTHINHTNPINGRGKERAGLKKMGFNIAYDGLALEV